MLTKTIKEALACRRWWVDIRDHGPRLGNENAAEMVHEWNVLISMLERAEAQYGKLVEMRR